MRSQILTLLSILLLLVFSVNNASSQENTTDLTGIYTGNDPTDAFYGYENFKLIVEKVEKGYNVYKIQSKKGRPGDAVARYENMQFSAGALTWHETDKYATSTLTITSNGDTINMVLTQNLSNGVKNTYESVYQRQKGAELLNYSDYSGYYRSTHFIVKLESYSPRRYRGQVSIADSKNYHKIRSIDLNAVQLLDDTLLIQTREDLGSGSM